MTQEQLNWFVIALSRLIGGYVLAASADNPQQLTADYKGYLENFMLQKDWQPVITAYEQSVLKSLPSAPAAAPSGPVPTP